VQFSAISHLASSQVTQSRKVGRTVADNDKEIVGILPPTQVRIFYGWSAMYFDFRLDLGFQQLMADSFVDLPTRWFTPVADRFPFQTLKLQTQSRLKQVRANQIPTTVTISEKESKNGKFSLSAEAWSIVYDDAYALRHSIATLRMVYIRGQKNEIINTWIFPKRPDVVPVFAAELISVGGVTRVAFVDIQTPVMNGDTVDEVTHLTTPLAARFACLPCDEKAPEWATSASPGNFTYSRQADGTWTSTIQECYLAYLDVYLKAYATGTTAENSARLPEDRSVTQELQAYQKHHMESSPGKKFLGNLFGVEWTDSFLTDFLFAKP